MKKTHNRLFGIAWCEEGRIEGAGVTSFLLLRHPGLFRNRERLCRSAIHGFDILFKFCIIVPVPGLRYKNCI